MIDFEGWQIPDGDLREVLVDSIHNYVSPRGDVGDQRPLDWVARLLDAHPELVDRVTAAYRELLLDRDDGVVADVLDQVPSHPTDMSNDLVTLIRDHADDLRARFGPYDSDTTLLGLVVGALGDMNTTQPPPPPAPELLAKLNDAPNGWPTSFLMAWAADFSKLAPRVIFEMGRMDDMQLYCFVLGMLGYPSLIDAGFEIIRQGPPRLCQKVVTILRENLDGMWPGYASHLEWAR